MTISPGPTHLYRFFDGDDQLLYVGVTQDLADRTTAHCRKEWGERAERIEIERFPTREEALRAEGRAIRDEMPAVNVAAGMGPLSDNSRRRLRALAKRRDQTAAEIAEAIVVARDEQATLREIATELGMSHGGVAFIEQKARKERGEDA